jgi:hypothetical protein
MATERLCYIEYDSFFREDLRLKEIQRFIWMAKNINDIDSHQELINCITDNPIFDAESNLRTDALDLEAKLREEIKRNIADIPNSDQLKRYLEYINDQIAVLNEWFGFWFRVNEVKENLDKIPRQLRNPTIYRLLADILYMAKILGEVSDFINERKAYHYPHDKSSSVQKNLVAGNPLRELFKDSRVFDDLMIYMNEQKLVKILDGAFEWRGFIGNRKYEVAAFYEALHNSQYLNSKDRPNIKRLKSLLDNSFPGLNVSEKTAGNKKSLEINDYETLLSTFAKLQKNKKSL